MKRRRLELEDDEEEIRGVINIPQPNTADLTGNGGEFVEVFGTDVGHDFFTGTLIVSATIADGALLGTWYQAAWVDVQVIGYLGGQRSILRRSILCQTLPVVLHYIEEHQLYQRITVECRRRQLTGSTLTESLQSPYSIPLTQMSVACQARFLRR